MVSGSARTPQAMEALISLCGSGLTANVTPELLQTAAVKCRPAHPDRLQPRRFQRRRREDCRCRFRLPFSDRREAGLEGAHAFGAPGGEDDGGDIFHDGMVTTLVQRHKAYVLKSRVGPVCHAHYRSAMEVQRPKTTSPPLHSCLGEAQFFERAQRILPRHLFAPVHDEVGVVEWASFDVSSFGGGLNVFVVEWLADQRGAGFLDFHRRRRDAAQNNPSVRIAADPEHPAAVCVHPFAPTPPLPAPENQTRRGGAASDTKRASRSVGGS